VRHQITDVIHRVLYERFWARHVNAIRDQGFVTFTFDDFPASALAIGGAILERYGLRGTYYAAPGLMGQESEIGKHFTLADLERGSTIGHEIANHSYAHMSCCDMEDEALIADSQRSNEVLAAYGVRNFAYPYGLTDLRVKRLLASRFDTCRGIVPGINGSDTDLNDLRANAIYSHRSLDRLFDLIEENTKVGGWLVFYTHDVSEEPSRLGVTVNDFEKLVKLVIKSGLHAGTIRDGLRRLAWGGERLSRFAIARSVANISRREYRKF
jgi:peptidoglycan/xylan/chitin deacetylase (PgdA/CDA1 family)